MGSVVTLAIDWLIQPVAAALCAWLLALVVLRPRPGPRRGPRRGTRRGTRQGPRRRDGTRRSRRGARVGWWLAAIGTIALWSLSTPRLSAVLVGLIESPLAPPACATQSALPIVVPGAGMDFWAVSDDPFRLLSRDSLTRTLFAAALPGTASIHVLGGGDNDRSIAASMADVLQRIGVKDSRIVQETASRSTRDNALRLGDALPAPAHIRLVTSALHLPRATRTFEAVGYDVCPVASSSEVSPSAGLIGWMPWTSGLVRSGEALRELLASALYAMRS